MARIQSNRGGRTSSRSKINNPEGHNQYNSGFIGMARERPAATAAAAAGAVAAGVFLWSKRAQISEQISLLSDQIGEWSETMSAERANRELETVVGDSAITGSANPTSRRGRSTTAAEPRSASSTSTVSTGNGGGPIA